jgi:hypothetical protein
MGPAALWRGFYPIAMPKYVYQCIPRVVTFSWGDLCQLDNGYMLKFVKDYSWMRVG